MTKGRIFSVESMGLVDGPGIRTVVFFRGCALRCRFCHNPESWNAEGEEIESEELVRRILRFRPYFERSGGGVTASGGEPLLQPDFLLELFSRCKEEGIHTCLDTAGFGDPARFPAILEKTDLVLYDVKAVTPEGYLAMTGKDIAVTEAFQDALRQSGKPAVVRQVVIPGISDSEEYMLSLQQYIKTNIPTAQRVELLPYHKAGIHKYTALGLSDPLCHVPQMDRDETRRLQATYFGT